MLEAGDAAGMPFPYPVVETREIPENTGSIGSVSIPLGQELLSRDKAQFLEELGERLDLAGRSLQVKREILEVFLKGGLYPYTWRYLGTLKNHRSGICLTDCQELEQSQKEALCDCARDYLGQSLSGCTYLVK